MEVMTREQVHEVKGDPQPPLPAGGSLMGANWNPKVLGAVSQEREGGGRRASQ